MWYQSQIYVSGHCCGLEASQPVDLVCEDRMSSYLWKRMLGWRAGINCWTWRKVISCVQKSAQMKTFEVKIFETLCSVFTCWYVVRISTCIFRRVHYARLRSPEKLPIDFQKSSGLRLTCVCYDGNLVIVVVGIPWLHIIQTPSGIYWCTGHVWQGWMFIAINALKF